MDPVEFLARQLMWARMGTYTHWTVAQDSERTFWKKKAAGILHDMRHHNIILQKDIEQLRHTIKFKKQGRLKTWWKRFKRRIAEWLLR